MKIEHLTATAEFTADCLVDNRIIVFKHIGLNRLTVCRRFFDNAHITQTAHCHIEGSRNRSSRKRKHIDIFAQFLESLLLSNTETLFLIYDCKSEVTEFNILLHKSVSSDNHINFSSL